MKKLQGHIIPMSQRLKRTRNATPRTVKALGPEWAAAQLAMADNLIGVGEAYVLPIPQELMDKHGITSIKAAARPLKKHVKTYYPGKYSIQALNTSEGPVIYINRPKPRKGTS